MFEWLHNKSELELLKEKYCRLMKKAYLLALKDKERSDKINNQAKNILHRIHELESSSVEV